MPRYATPRYPAPPAPALAEAIVDMLTSVQAKHPLEASDLMGVLSYLDVELHPGPGTADAYRDEYMGRGL